MGRNLYHSAEGSHWTKKNHKYIRKEGNRYIYPEDVNKTRRAGGGGIQRTKDKTARDILSDKGVRRVRYRDHIDKNNGPYTARLTDYKTKNGNYERRIQPDYDPIYGNGKYPKSVGTYNVNDEYDKEIRSNNEKSRQAQNRANAGSGRPDYKKLSEQHANRQAAKSGKIVNPTYTLRDDQGNKVMRLQSKDKLSTPTVADYKKFSQQRANREAAKNGVKEIYQFDDGSSWREYGRSTQEFAKDNGRNKIKQMRQKKALNNQGSNDRQQQAKSKVESNKPKYSKEYQEAVKSNSAKNEYFGTKSINGQKGHFTFDSKTGQTIFVPDDEGTKKRVSKGRQIVDKIKSKFSKKK